MHNNKNIFTLIILFLFFLSQRQIGVEDGFSTPLPVENIFDFELCYLNVTKLRGEPVCLTNSNWYFKEQYAEIFD